MSDDPVTARQIAELSLDSRPLLVLDVDDVLLEFVNIFPTYLNGRGYFMVENNFKLYDNIVDAKGAYVARLDLDEIIHEFFAEQANWQTLIDGAAEALACFGDQVEIVLLTAMPHRHWEPRRAHLDQLGLPYPLLTTEAAKGPAIAKLRGKTARPVAFVDDIPHNLESTKAVLPDAYCFHMMPSEDIRALPTPVEKGVVLVRNWAELAPQIADVLGVELRKAA